MEHKFNILSFVFFFFHFICIELKIIEIKQCKNNLQIKYLETLVNFMLISSVNSFKKIIILIFCRIFFVLICPLIKKKKKNHMYTYLKNCCKCSSPKTEALSNEFLPNCILRFVKIQTKRKKAMNINESIICSNNWHRLR